MEEKIGITFIYTEDEYVAAARLFYARVYHSRFQFFFGVLLSFLGLIGVAAFGVLFELLILLTIGTILLGLSSYVLYVAPRQQFRSDPMFRERYFLSFAEEGMLFRSKNTESKIEWNFYNKVWETPQFYFLYYGKNAFLLIPKRAFVDGNQETLFRNLLQRKVNPHFETQGMSARRIKDSTGYEPPLPPHAPPDWR